MTIAIETHELTKSFRLPHEVRNSIREYFIHPLKRVDYEKNVAVDRVSFEVEEGECFGIIGPNGSGKSTLMKLIAGIYRADGYLPNSIFRFGQLRRLGNSGDIAGRQPDALGLGREDAESDVPVGGYLGRNESWRRRAAAARRILSIETRTTDQGDQQTCRDGAQVEGRDDAWLHGLLLMAPNATTRVGTIQLFGAIRTEPRKRRNSFSHRLQPVVGMCAVQSAGRHDRSAVPMAL